MDLKLGYWGQLEHEAHIFQQASQAHANSGGLVSRGRVET